MSKIHSFPQNRNHQPPDYAPSAVDPPKTAEPEKCSVFLVLAWTVCCLLIGFFTGYTVGG